MVGESIQFLHHTFIGMPYDYTSFDGKSVIALIGLLSIIHSKHLNTSVISKELPYLGHTDKERFHQQLFFIKPARSAGFSRIKKIPYQAPPTQLGPRKCTLWQNAFLGPKYQF